MVGIEEEGREEILPSVEHARPLSSRATKCVYDALLNGQDELGVHELGCVS